MSLPVATGTEAGCYPAYVRDRWVGLSRPGWNVGHRPAFEIETELRNSGGARTRGADADLTRAALRWVLLPQFAAGDRPVARKCASCRCRINALARSQT